MTTPHLQLLEIEFSGPDKKAYLRFASGVNVICGASETGKSFLAESLDYMLGGSNLRDIPELAKYATLAMSLVSATGNQWRIERSISGGDFLISDPSDPGKPPQSLKQTHRHDKIDNLSGFLLDNLGLLGKRILRNKRGESQSLSFRNLARLIIVQEGQIQQIGSPFWGGQYTLKTTELATIKLLLTGIDDSGVVTADTTIPDNSKQILLIDELLSDLSSEIQDIGQNKEESTEQLVKLNESIDAQRASLDLIQSTLAEKITARRQFFEDRRKIEQRLEEIAELLARFELLKKHYVVDMERLVAIQESGSLLTYYPKAPCPLCGAPTEAQHSEEKCDGDVASIVQAATSEILKIEILSSELLGTISELEDEAESLNTFLTSTTSKYEQLNLDIQKSLAPQVEGEQTTFSTLIEKRSFVQRALDVHEKSFKLEQRRKSLLEDDSSAGDNNKIVTGLPESIAHSFSQKVSQILKAWNFPGDCHTYFDKETSDFVIDGKPRGSRGKGLRAITHAAVTIGLLEYCQENHLPHPGFVVLDSPLLAYFKPEGADDIALQGTDLKERFYTYLIDHHSADSQIIIIENQHPPETLEDRLAMIVFTRNPNEGRYGLL